jgi:ribA/ribD-fused uncharacterized protein
MVPLDLASLRAAVAQGHRFEYRYFFGHTPRPDGKLSNACLSQWWPCRFSVDGVVYSSAEQWMMAAKARTFDDQATLARILETHDPAAVKQLGREVRGFDGERWDALRFDLVTAGNVAKFGDDPGLREFLLDTGQQVLVEAAPRDQIWGIGLSAGNDKAKDPATWRGRNLLGFALMRARGILRQELPPPRS